MLVSMRYIPVLQGALACTMLVAPAQAVCVSPKAITEAATGAKDTWNTPAPEAKHSGKFVLGIVKDLLDDDSSEGVQNLTADTVEQQFNALKGNKAVWQEVLIEGETDPELTSNALKVCKRVQEWANDGEIVVAMWAPSGNEPVRISIVVPDQTDPATKATTGPWKGVPVPRVAFASDVAAAATGVSLEISDLVATLKNGSAPKDMHFFRYRL